MTIEVDRKVMDALSALAGATTWAQYNAAKRLVARLGRVEQLAAVDSIKEARRRVEGRNR